MTTNWVDLDTEAKITIADILNAREQWRQDAPEQYRDLLDAKVST